MTSFTKRIPTCPETDFLHYRYQLDQVQVLSTILQLLLICLGGLAYLKASPALAGLGVAVAALGYLLVLLLRVRAETTGWEAD